MSETQPEPNSNRRRNIAIGVVVLLLVAAGVVAGWALRGNANGTPKPQPTATPIYSFLPLPSRVSVPPVETLPPTQDCVNPGGPMQTEPSGNGVVPFVIVECPSDTPEPTTTP